jgi:hypothetical protein
VYVCPLSLHRLFETSECAAHNHNGGRTFSARRRFLDRWSDLPAPPGIPFERMGSDIVANSKPEGGSVHTGRSKVDASENTRIHYFFKGRGETVEVALHAGHPV